jgi:isopentenyldiphosphate isomerase
LTPSHIWKTKDGQTIRITDMSDSHLVNAIKMIQRNIQSYKSQIIEQEIDYVTRFSGDPTFNSIVGEDVVYKYMDMEDEKFLLDYHPTYKIMLGEAQHRGLELCTKIKI